MPAASLIRPASARFAMHSARKEAMQAEARGVAFGRGTRLRQTIRAARAPGKRPVLRGIAA